MKRYKAFLLAFTIITFITCLTSCRQYRFKHHYDPQVKTFTTSQGDHLQITATFKQTLHDTFLYYEVLLPDSEELTYFSTNISDTGYPDDPFETFSFVANTDNINIYELQDAFLFVSGNHIYRFHGIKENDNKAIDYYCLDYDQDIRAKTVIDNSLNAICQTKRMKYLEQYDKIFARLDDSPIYSIAQRWSENDITIEEINANQNDGYTVEEMKNWAFDFSQEKAKTD